MTETEKTNILILKFSVNGQRIYYDEKNKAVAGSRQYLYAAFDFSGEWQSPKFALFSTDKNPKTPKAVKLDENDGCYVPYEFIKSPGFYVSVYCAYGEILITADRRKVSVLPSGYSNKIVPEVIPEEPEETEPENPEETVVESILGEILEEAGNVNRYLYNAETIGIFDTAHGAAQSAAEGPAALIIQQEALDGLREAIDNLVPASFALASGSISMSVGSGNNKYPVAAWVVYNGIGTVTARVSTAAEQYVTFLENGTIANPKKNGMFTMYFAVPEFAELQKSASIA